MSRFDAMYAGSPPWEIGRPQQEIVRLEEAGEIAGDVLDVGCGTGENALYLAGRGHAVWGVDSAPAAIGRAEAKAAARGVRAGFLVAYALELWRLGRTFDTAIDSGLFHALTDAQRPLFCRSLSAALCTGGMYFMLCFSEHEPGDWGPRRVTQAEIRDSFRDGWTVRSIRAARFENTHRPEGARAWLAAIRHE